MPSARSRASWRASSLARPSDASASPQCRALFVAGHEACPTIGVDGLLLGDDLLPDGGDLRPERLQPSAGFAERQTFGVGLELDEHVAACARFCLPSG